MFKLLSFAASSLFPVCSLMAIASSSYTHIQQHEGALALRGSMYSDTLTVMLLHTIGVYAW